MDSLYPTPSGLKSFHPSTTFLLTQAAAGSICLQEQNRRSRGWYLTQKQSRGKWLLSLHFSSLCRCYPSLSHPWVKSAARVQKPSTGLRETQDQCCRCPTNTGYKTFTIIYNCVHLESLWYQFKRITQVIQYNMWYLHTTSHCLTKKVLPSCCSRQQYCFKDNKMIQYRL